MLRRVLLTLTAVVALSVGTGSDGGAPAPMARQAAELRPARWPEPRPAPGRSRPHHDGWPAILVAAAAATAVALAGFALSTRDS